MWKKFSTEFLVKSPIHIGCSKLGIISRTRYFVPGKNFWGALTSKISPLIGKDYRVVGEFLRDNLVFSYHFFKDDKTEFYPNYGEKGIEYFNNSINNGNEDTKPLKASDFEKNYLGNIVSTAINEENQTAEEETLHELEYIQAVKGLCLVGNIYAKENKKDDLELKINNKEIFMNEISITKILLENELTIGGRLSYGFGLIRLNELKYCEDKKLEISFKKESIIDAHLLVEENLDVWGEVETVTGREYCDKGSGRKFSTGFLAWVPGSCVKEEIKVEICPELFGVYRRVKKLDDN